jgi:O-antigen/teichoic acid export membrane protein
MIEGTTGPAPTGATPGALLSRLQTLLVRPGLRQGVAMFAATSLANVLDYAYNVAMGRLLSTDGYGVLVALQAVLQIASVSLVVVRTVTARYAAEFLAREQLSRAGDFFWSALRTAALWGAIVALSMGLLSGPMARLLHIPTAVPVLITAAALWPLMLKPVLGGALQGLQRFGALGAFQVAHAAFRLVLGLLLVKCGLDAVGALTALPVGTLGTALLGLVLLGSVLWQRTGDSHQLASSDVSRYAGATVLGLVSFAALVNMDALVVKHYFSPTEAGTYSMAVTLGKIVIFLPAAFAVVLFPKSAERHVQRRDSSRLLRLSLAVTALPCAGLAAAYFAAPDFILKAVFDAENPFAGPVLGLVALAMTGYALVNVWLSYFLSVEQSGFVYALPVVVAAQFALLTIFHASLTQVAVVVALTSAGVLAVAEAWFHFHKESPRRKGVGDMETNGLDSL